MTRGLHSIYLNTLNPLKMYIKFNQGNYSTIIDVILNKHWSLTE